MGPCRVLPATGNGTLPDIYGSMQRQDVSSRSTCSYDTSHTA
jgi:hypothetical protein